MRTSITLLVLFALGAPRLAAQQPRTMNLSQIIDKILSQERGEMESLQQYSPLVETYIQYLLPDKELGEVPNGDKYLLGHAELGKAVRVVRVTNGLGHGLDEAAVHAAEQIRFKPALQDGRPVDFPATVHIEFQLAF